MGRSVQELTKAYVATEGVLRSPLISPATREKLEGFLSVLEKEIAQAIREQLDQNNPAAN